jgi:hypothetical protein
MTKCPKCAGNHTLYRNEDGDPECWACGWLETTTDIPPLPERVSPKVDKLDGRKPRLQNGLANISRGPKKTLARESL